MKIIKLLILLFFCSHVIAQDSLDVKIGQMLMVGMAKTTPDEGLLADIEAGRVGGVILFEKNIELENSYLRLKSTTWTLQDASSTPLFIAIDQEGGRVNRLKEKYGFPHSVTAQYLGKTGNLDSTRFYAEITAATLAGLGFNVNFAPVVDLAINPKNPVIYKAGRSFGASADSVAMHAKAVVEAHRNQHVITVLKHFPGHGSSIADTHFGIADVTKFWKEEEIEPYKKLLATNDVDGVMTAHIVNKNLEPAGLPGTLSRKVINDLLRNDLGYSGVVFSDDMQMHAIEKHFGLENAIALAIDAGVDVLIFSNNIQNSKEQTVDRVHSIIKNLVQSGKLSEDRINSSYERILKLKSSQ